MNRTPEEMNKQLTYLLGFFSEETDHVKLYINYPMVESIRYTKDLPDDDYYTYAVTREDCREFKRLTADFSSYPNMDFILRGTEEDRTYNWEMLKKQNVAKANFICNGVNEYPPVERESISQSQILQHQSTDYETRPGCQVSVLSSFPILLYDWLGK